MARRRQCKPGPFLLHVELLRERIPDEDCYPYNLPVIRRLSRLEFHPKVTFLVGENGTGKSTLLEGIAVGCGLNPEGGSRNFNFATHSSHSPLEECLRLAWIQGSPRDSYFLRAESFYNVASEIERLDTDDPDDHYPPPPPIINSYGGQSLHKQSHGESFFALFQHRLGGEGLYLMDEPEAALSPKRQLHFLRILHEHVTCGSQFIIATHSPIIMAYPDACIYVLDQAGIRTVPYEQTDHYLVTRGFLSNPQRTLSGLLAPEAGP